MNSQSAAIKGTAIIFLLKGQSSGKGQQSFLHERDSQQVCIKGTLQSIFSIIPTQGNKIKVRGTFNRKAYQLSGKKLYV